MSTIDPVRGPQGGDSPATRAGIVPGPLIQRSAADCKDCWGCVRYCPSRAIRVVDGHGEIIEEKCVKCGLCVSECANSGHQVRDDTPAVRALLGSGRPVVAILATEFVAALHPRSPSAVERTLESLGFYAVESTLLGEELVAEAYEARHALATGVPVIRSTCPVVNEWVRRFRPALTGALAPVVPPYVAQARLVRELYPADIAVVYAGPCYARKDEWWEEGFEGDVDAVIDLGELAGMLDAASLGPAGETPDAGIRRPEPLKELSLIDGYPRATLASRTMMASDVQVIRGLKDLDRLLGGISAGEAAPLIIDALCCEGCIDGPAVNPGMSLFAKRNIDASEREARMCSAVSSRALLKHLPKVDLVRSFSPAPVHIPKPTDAEVDATLAEGQIPSRADAIDCGACGYPTCVEHAVAILDGDSSWEMCFPLQRDRCSSSIKELEQHATIDHLTGLWNRRVFSERLVDELARYQRYGTALSLLMIDLDGFKKVNDSHGHVVGDRIIVAVAKTLADSLRKTDLPCRYGGDEFGVLLPGVHKTDAYAVAEKVREAIGEAMLGLGEGNGEVVAVRASIGVASASRGMGDAVELVEAADRALYRAKDAGGDRAMIAPD